MQALFEDMEASVKASVDTPTKITNHLGTFYFKWKDSADEFIDKAKHLTLETLGEAEYCFRDCHREDGPAIELINGHKEWRINNGHKEWGEQSVHTANNEDPDDPYCIITADNRKYYYRDGFLHNENKEVMLTDTIRNDEFGVTFRLAKYNYYTETHYGLAFEFDGVNKILDTDDLFKLVGEDHRDILRAFTNFGPSHECHESYNANNDYEEVIEYDNFRLNTMECVYDDAIDCLYEYKKIDEDYDEIINLLKAVNDKIKEAKQFVDDYNKWIKTPINNYGSDIKTDNFTERNLRLDTYRKAKEDFDNKVKSVNMLNLKEDDQDFKMIKIHACQRRYFIAEQYGELFTVWGVYRHDPSHSRRYSSYDTPEDALNSMRKCIEQDDRNA